jgi:2-keto-3-deoxy-L-rhamnonate aldolase RhmA
MIETPQALQNAEAIANVPGVDGLYVGMRDLALRLGRDVDDYTAHASLADELDHVVKSCQRAGKAAAVLVSSPDELVSRIQDGYQLICAGADLNILEVGWRQMREVFEKATRDTKR